MNFAERTKKIYPWKRYWCRPDFKVSLSDGGYLTPPRSFLGEIENKGLKSLDELRGIQCLILLGEPGIGKSTELETDNVKSNKTLFVRVDSVTSGDIRFKNEIFNHEKVVSWKNAKHGKFELILDGLDEAITSIDGLSQLLVYELKKLPLERLLLRISCRTAAWPLSLEEDLVTLFKKDNFDKYMLAALSKEDVRLAIDAEVQNSSDHFLDEVNRVEAVSLAAQPLTLEMLINIYREDHQLPQSKHEVYTRGLRRLTLETPARARSQPLLATGINRFDIASKIAALMVFSNRYAVYTGADDGLVQEGTLTLEEILNGFENSEDPQISCDEPWIRETLNSGLFSLRGDEILAFAHRTYAEFLAAFYLHHQKVPAGQVMALISHPTDPSGRIVPQLAETAALLATMNMEIFSTLLDRDPQVLLASDLQTVDIKQRAKLTERLLLCITNDELKLDWWVVYKQIPKLKHPGLTNQLKPYITNPMTGKDARNIAIDIAEACELLHVQEDLLKVALDVKEPYCLRTNAAHAVARIGDETTCGELIHLATGKAGDDPDDELKGIALQSVWPSKMKTSDMIQHMTFPQDEYHLGAYWSFLEFHVPANAQLADIPLLLTWISTLPPVHKMPSGFRKLYEKVLKKSLGHLNEPEIVSTLAKTIINRLKIDHQIIPGYSDEDLYSDFIKDEEGRRRLICEIVEKIGFTSQDLDMLVYSDTPLVLKKDMTWLLNNIKRCQVHIIRERWTQLANRVDPLWTPQVSWLPYSIISAYGNLRSSVLRLRLRSRRWLYKKKQHKRMKPPLRVKIKQLLKKSESGDLNAWWQLIPLLDLKPTGHSTGNEFKIDILRLPGWNSAKHRLKKRIIKAAGKYVLKANPHTNDWIGKKTFDRRATAGCQAIFLLRLKDNQFYNNIPRDIWRKWAPSIVWYSQVLSSDRSEGEKDLLSAAFEKAPEEAKATLIRLIEKEDQEHKNVYILPHIRHCIDTDLADLLLQKAKENSLQPEASTSIVAELLLYGYEPAKAYAESLLTPDLLLDEADRFRTIGIATAVLEYSDNAGWELIWPLFQVDADFGRKVVQRVSYYGRNDGSNFLRKLDAIQLAELFKWMVQQYPYHDHRRKSGIVSPEESAEDFRDAIITSLREWGSPEAVAAIETLSKEFPKLNWLAWTLSRAKNNELRKTWIPPSPNEVKQLVVDSKKRLVRSADELAEVVIEALRGLEKRLQGENPASPALWNEEKKGNQVIKRWHKDESDFSDWIKCELESALFDRRVVFNREVQIKRGSSVTDIHVDAFTKTKQGLSPERAKVIIEVKGCWNPKLETDMENQLVKKYLTTADCRHGIYLVEWFYCAICVPIGGPLERLVQGDDYGIHAAQDYFDNQAEELSKGEVKVRAIVLNTGIHD